MPRGHRDTSPSLGTTTPTKSLCRIFPFWRAIERAPGWIVFVYLPRQLPQPLAIFGHCEPVWQGFVLRVPVLMVLLPLHQVCVSCFSVDKGERDAIKPLRFARKVLSRRWHLWPLDDGLLRRSFQNVGESLITSRPHCISLHCAL